MKPSQNPLVRLFVLIGVLVSFVWLASCVSDTAGVINETVRRSGGGDQSENLDISLPFDPATVRFSHYGIDSGLSMGTVFDVIQDQKGYIWIATEDGLNRFDGYAFKVYRSTPDDPYALSNNNVHALFEDRDGFIWIGVSEGVILQYDPFTDRFQEYLPTSGFDEIRNATLYEIVQDQDGVLWFCGSGGLYSYNPDRDLWGFYSSPKNDDSTLAANTIFVDPSGLLWLGTVDGISIFDPETQQVSRYQHDPDDPASIQGAEVYDIFQDAEGDLWVGTDAGLSRFDAEMETFENWDFSDASSGTNAVYALLEDVRGNIWVGTRQGLIYFSPKTGQSTRYLSSPDDPSGLSNDWVNALYADRMGGLWISTAYGGVSYFNPLMEKFRYFIPSQTMSDQVSENSVWAVYMDPSDALWLGTNGGGLKKCTLDANTCQDYRFDPDDPVSLSNDVVMDIFHEGESLWVATWGGGLNRFDLNSGEFSHFRSDPGDPTTISSDVVWLIRDDQQGKFWIGTMEGLNYFDPETGAFKRFLHDPDNPETISSDIIVAIHEDRNGQIWIGTQDGLNIFDRETQTFTRIYHDPNDLQSISHNTVFALHEDRYGRFWMGTYGGGLNRYDPRDGTFEHYRVTDGLVNDSIYGILEDDDGNLWISTNNGISKFNPFTDTFKNFGVSDGLQGGEFNFNAYYKNSRGEMFFGGVNGVTIFDPDQIIDNPYPPEIVLQSVSQGGEPLILDGAFEYADELTLRWPNNYFDFEFASINYFQSEYNQHAYMLENFDADWNWIDSRRFGRYTNLPGGRYTLRMIGSNNDGVWNEEGKTIVIRIVPPIWQNGWFIGTIAGLFIVGIALAYRSRVRYFENQAEALEQQVKIRTEEINTRRKQIEALYQADEDLYRHLDVNQVLQALVDTSVQILGADKGSLLCWDETKEFLVIRASHNFHRETIAETRIPKGMGVVGQVAETGNATTVEDTAKDPRVTLSITEVEDIRAFIQVPIKTGDEVFGVFSADYAAPRTFEEGEKRLLTSLAQRAAIAIQNAQVYAQAQELAASQERNRLARELHDAVTQTLFSASLIAEALPALWERDPDKGRARLEKLRQMSRGALAEMRALLLELRPAALLETNLENLLRQLGEALMGRERISVLIDVEGACKLPPDVHIALYRIAQEALNNIVKHARADKARIKLVYLCGVGGQFEGISLQIEDNGRGFVLQEVLPDHLGLEIMRERADSISAEFTIDSQLGKGTIITVTWHTERKNGRE